MLGVSTITHYTLRLGSTAVRQLFHFHLTTAVKLDTSVFFSVGRRMVYDGRNALELESNRSGNRHRVIRLGLFDEDLTA